MIAADDNGNDNDNDKHQRTVPMPAALGNIYDQVMSIMERRLLNSSVDYLCVAARTVWREGLFLSRTFLDMQTCTKKKKSRSNVYNI